ncbi:MAG: carboxypeptidase-like regulatory domain-containing protein [Bacteroidia bacterium]
MEPNYNCAQQDLYSALNTIWDNYLIDQAEFMAYKAGYTVLKGTTAKVAIKAAKDLPDDQARSGPAELLRNKVKDAADKVIGNFVQTKGYINGITAEADRKTTYQIAGQNYYRKATNDDWESVSGMATSMNNYLVANATALEDGGTNMPATFPAAVLANITAFETFYGQFKTASETGVKTDAKITANNGCMTTGRAMMDDAVIVFRKNPSKAELYIFDRILDSISPDEAGMKGEVIDSNTNVGIEGAEVKMQQAGKPAILTATDEDGHYEKTGIESGTYTVTITKAGFQTVTEIIVIKPGTVSGRDFPLQHTP